MTTSDPLLMLRPVLTTQRLGTSPVPILSPGDLSSALADVSSCLLCVTVPAMEVVPGLLRAARDQDALLGVSLSHPPPHRDSAERFFSQVRAFAEELRIRRPLFLQAGPIRVTDADERALEALAGDAFRFVDAGFSSLSIDASGLAPDDGIRAYVAIAAAAAERELAIEVTAPRGDGRPDAAHLSQFLSALVEAGVAPRFVRVRGRAVIPEAAPGAESSGDFAWLREAADAVESHGAGISIEDTSTPPKLWRSWAANRARKIDVGFIARRLLTGWPMDRRIQLQQLSDERGLPLAELMGRRESLLANASRESCERVEALCYADAFELLAELGLRGSASRATAVLSRRSDA